MCYCCCASGNTPCGRLTPTNSPLRQSGRRTPPFMPPQLFSAPPMLPPILGSPTKLGLGGQDNPAGDICGNTTNLPLAHRAITLPEMTSVSRDLTLGQCPCVVLCCLVTVDGPKLMILSFFFVVWGIIHIFT